MVYFDTEENLNEKILRQVLQFCKRTYTDIMNLYLRQTLKIITSCKRGSHAESKNMCIMSVFSNLTELLWFLTSPHTVSFPLLLRLYTISCVKPTVRYRGFNRSSDITVSHLQWFNRTDYPIFTQYQRYRRVHPMQPFYILHPRFEWQVWQRIQDNMAEPIQKNPPSSGLLGMSNITSLATSCL